MWPEDTSTHGHFAEAQRPNVGTGHTRRSFLRRGAVGLGLAAAGSSAAPLLAPAPAARAEPLSANRLALSAPRYGMNLSNGKLFTGDTYESTVQQATRIKATYGAFPVAKCFYPRELPPSYNAKYEGQVPVAYVSCKYDQVKLANGDYDAAIKAYVASIPAGKVVRLIQWQEPDAAMWVPKKFKFTMAQHRAATDRMCQVVQASSAYAAGRVEVWECLMAYSLEVDRYDDVAISRKVDGISWSKYWNTPELGRLDPREILDQMVVATAALNKPYALLEVGDLRPGYGDLEQTFAHGWARAEFWTRVFDHADATGWTDVAWFNGIGTLGDHRLIPGDPYSDPTIKVLKERMNR